MGQRDAAEIHQATLSHHPSTDCFLGTAVLSQRKSQHHLMMSPYRHSESWDTDRFVLSIHSLLWQCCAGAIHDHWLACRKKLTPAKLSMILWLCYMLLGLCWAWRPCCGTFWKLLLQIVLMSGLILDRLCSRLPTFHTVPLVSLLRLMRLWISSQLLGKFGIDTFSILKALSNRGSERPMHLAMCTTHPCAVVSAIHRRMAAVGCTTQKRWSKLGYH